MNCSLVILCHTGCQSGPLTCHTILIIPTVWYLREWQNTWKLFIGFFFFRYWMCLCIRKWIDTKHLNSKSKTQHHHYNHHHNHFSWNLKQQQSKTCFTPNPSVEMKKQYNFFYYKWAISYNVQNLKIAPFNLSKSHSHTVYTVYNQILSLLTIYKTACCC